MQAVRARKDTELPNTEKTTKRVQLELPVRAYERLVNLKVETEASTYSEVLKNALRLYEFAVQKSKEDCEFMMKKKDGSVVPLPIFGPGM
jgi:hypothetical protein